MWCRLFCAWSFAPYVSSRKARRMKQMILRLWYRPWPEWFLIENGNWTRQPAFVQLSSTRDSRNRQSACGPCEKHADVTLAPSPVAYLYWQTNRPSPAEETIAPLAGLVWVGFELFSLIFTVCVFSLRFLCPFRFALQARVFACPLARSFDRLLARSLVRPSFVWSSVWSSVCSFARSSTRFY